MQILNQNLTSQPVMKRINIFGVFFTAVSGLHVYGAIAANF